VLESVGDGWKESGAENHDFKIWVTADSADISKGIFDVLEHSIKLC
jgi:hypothetical protein